jgi:hypothetical protein
MIKGKKYPIWRLVKGKTHLEESAFPIRIWSKITIHCTATHAFLIISLGLIPFIKLNTQYN